MAKIRHEHSALIDAIGADRVSLRFQLTPQRLHMWRRRGIPQLRRVAFAKLAAENGIATPSDFFEELAA